MLSAFEKKILSRLLLFLFAALMLYTVVIRTASYGMNSLPRVPGVSFRIVGENLGGDYALLHLLENRGAETAYDTAEQTRHMADTAGTKGRFFSFAAPSLPLMLVPLMPLSYEDVFSTWLMWGIFLFSAALYTLFPLRRTLFLLFAMPAVLFAVSDGGWGLYLAALFIFALRFGRTHPVFAGLTAGLTAASPVAFTVLTVAQFGKKRFKAALIALCFGGFILVGAGLRYGFSSYAEAFWAATNALQSIPCVFASAAAAFLCAGFSLPVAAAAQIAVSAAALYFGIRLFRRPLCPPSVLNAYVCAGTTVFVPVWGLGNFGLMYAAVAFLLFDSERRGFLREDLFWIVLAFVTPFLETFAFAYTGVPLCLAVSCGLLRVCWKRSL
ncbi:MAG: hypothetical protein ACI4PW_08595 [Alphaproteobacteria bacterium]|jgi:hypothetical protein